jgi:hypothetical protein
MNGIDLVLTVFLVAGSLCDLLLACDISLDLTAVIGDCSKFYRCDGSRLYVQSCGSGTVFDTSLKVCNWPSLVVNCGVQTTPKPTYQPVRFAAPDASPSSECEL